MKALKVISILLVTTLVIVWTRGEDSFDIRRALPLVNDKPGLYQGGGLAMVALLLWGLSRLSRKAGPDTDNTPSSFDAPPMSDDDE